MIRCSCGHHFAPSAATYSGTQFYTDIETGAVWLYLLLFLCPSCSSTRALVMHEDTEDAEALSPIAAE